MLGMIMCCLGYGCRYYALDHFDPANRARRDVWEAKGWFVLVAISDPFD